MILVVAAMAGIIAGHYLGFLWGILAFLVVLLILGYLELEAYL